MFSPFIACAAITAISSLVSLGFSVIAARNEILSARTMALYACARSGALVVASAVPFWTGSAEWLLAIALIMVIVQAGDSLIGVTIRDRMKTFGPAATSVVNLLALIWLYQSIP